MIARALELDFVRFGAVAVAGLALDLSLSWTLATIAGVPLPLAALCGFVFAAAVNYVLHERWTFGAGQLSTRRGSLYLGVLLVTLGVRVGSVALLQAFAFPGSGRKLPILVLATGASFLVNYILSRHVVFSAVSRQARGPSPATPTPPERWQVPEHTVASFAPRRHDFALVIPVINEGERIRAQLRRTAAAALAVDVIVADGGSTDGSLAAGFLEEVGVRALLTKLGPGKLSAQLRMAYGWCLREGYEGIVTIDGNGKDNVEAVELFLERLREGYDYVQGSRYRPGGKAENTPLERTIGNRLIHAPVLSLAGRHWFTDTTNGFRGYSARYLRDDRVQPFRDVFMRYELLFYLTARAGQLGYRVCEVPVRRSYPASGKTPTKIAGTGAKLALLRELFQAATGAFNP